MAWVGLCWIDFTWGKKCPELLFGSRGRGSWNTSCVKEWNCQASFKSDHLTSRREGGYIWLVRSALFFDLRWDRIANEKGGSWVWRTGQAVWAIFAFREREREGERMKSNLLVNHLILWLASIVLHLNHSPVGFLWLVSCCEKWTANRSKWKGPKSVTWRLEWVQ